jgi:Ca2+-binding EF-hand superfamily protein
LDKLANLFFESADQNGDGRISPGEIAGTINFHDPLISRWHPQSPEQMQLKFSFADKNGDGTLDVDEFGVFNKPERSDRIDEYTQYYAAEAIKAGDVDNSGGLTFHEYYDMRDVTVAKAHLKMEELDARTKKAFEQMLAKEKRFLESRSYDLEMDGYLKFDSDKNKELDQAEFAKYKFRQANQVKRDEYYQKHHTGWNRKFKNEHHEHHVEEFAQREVRLLMERLAPGSLRRDGFLTMKDILNDPGFFIGRISEDFKELQAKNAQRAPPTHGGL